MSETRYVIDLAAERVGGNALAASDEFFAPRENLLKPGRGVFIEDRYTDRGKWMDGWESRRRRTPGYDWCVVRLGLPGRIRSVTVDTNHFRGNNPEACSLDACTHDGSDLPPDDAWAEIVPRQPLNPHAEHEFAVTDEARWTHVRLNIYPDGGVARLRIHGDPLPYWEQLVSSPAPLDLASITLGGCPEACSDEFFSHPLNLVMPDASRNMGDGWETKRRRGPGHDWVVLRLGCRGRIEEVDVDTSHFKGNFPDSCSLEVRDGADGAWREILPQTRLQADTHHRFRDELTGSGPATHVRLNIFPDGGVARLRVYGRPAT